MKKPGSKDETVQTSVKKKLKFFCKMITGKDIQVFSGGN